MFRRIDQLFGNRNSSTQLVNSAPQQDFTILIPVFEETSALEFSIYFFQRMGVRPLYVLDSKRRDRKPEVEKLVGNAVPIYENNDGKTAEANFDKLISVSPTDWILRVDCDEVPNQEALAYCKQFMQSRSRGTVGFERPQLYFANDRLQAVADQDYNATIASVQWRFFNRKTVKVDRRIHTPGYKLPLWGKTVAPLPASLFHLEWVFTTPQGRAEKSVRYDSVHQAPHMRSLQLRDPKDSISVPSNNSELEQIFQEWFMLSGRTPPNQERKTSKSV